MPTPKNSPFLFGSALLGIFSFLIVLAFHHLADGDVWAKMILGSFVVEMGTLLKRDLFAFTPTLSHYADHEWGAGLIFYTFLKWFGPTSLMLLKMFLALGALLVAARTALLKKCNPLVLLFLALPCGICLLPGYVVVIRSHAFTYLFFALTLLGLEEIERGKKWPIPALIALIAIWTNVHGGFVAGLGTIGIYAAVAVIRRKQGGLMVLLTLGCQAATVLNPYGIAFWKTILPAILHKRPNIEEWGPMPLWGIDAFIGFRILIVIVVLSLIFGWRKRGLEALPSLAMLAITAFIAIRSRRHAPFFAIASLAFAGTYLECALQRLIELTKRRIAIQPAAALLFLYAGVFIFVATKFLPQASLQVLAPVRSYPVREVDILSQAGVSGNLVLPFEWGSYGTWRLYPNIKVSIDGRYEAAYPEETFQKNINFMFKTGADWDRLVKEHRVDFIILDFKTCAVTQADLQSLGYAPVWIDQGYSGLFASAEHLERLRKTASELPPTTIEPLDARIPQKFWNGTKIEDFATTEN